MTWSVPRYSHAGYSTIIESFSFKVWGHFSNASNACQPVHERSCSREEAGKVMLFYYLHFGTMAHLRMIFP